MFQRCPVCKTPLWSRGLFSSQLKCPRCGAQFRSTVPWAYFRLSLILIVLLLICLIVFFAQQTAWLVLLFLGLVVAFLWYLPKIVDLQQILPTDLTLAEGPGTREDLQLKLDYRSWKEEDDDSGSRGLGDLLYLLGFLVVVLIVVILLKSLS